MNEQPPNAGAVVKQEPSPEEYHLMKMEIALLKKKVEQQTDLPHLYGFPLYRWAHDFIESRNPENYMCAGNQLSKSSTLIRKCIRWCTEPSLWKELWPKALGTPNLFWYLYPHKDVATEEFTLKWSEFLPRGKMKNDPVYGWKVKYKDQKIYRVDWNSGMTLIFKTYSQDKKDLQTGSVYAIFADEEIPVDLLPELSARLNATDGYFSNVFTATIGQDYWRRVIEGKGESEEKPHAFKQQISMYDCQVYMDGSPSPWTDDKIVRAIQKCPSQSEVLRRIYGRFVVGGGLMYEAFDRDKNTYPNHVKIPHDWKIYGGVDIGTGGEKGHPAAYVFVAVSADYRQGRVFKGRRLDGILTTSQDILGYYCQDRGDLKVVIQTYDYHAKDFWTFASRKGEAFTMADKRKDAGIQTLNSLFKGEMLKIRKDDKELEKLMNELSTLQLKKDKRDSVDDFIDALRYCVMHIPWDWTALDDQEWSPNKFPVKKEVVEQTEAEIRRDFALGKNQKEPDAFEQEFMEWNELSGTEIFEEY